MHVTLAGAFSNFKHISYYIFKNKHILSDIKLTVFDSLNNCNWAGGRINNNTTYTADQVNFYKRNGIGINLIFTNNVVDINDSTGNQLLEEFHEDGNGVVLINDMLREHIRSNFPEYKLTYSITGTDNISMPMSDNDFNHYKSLEPYYDYIVLRAEHNLDPRLHHLNKNKYEIYITEGCTPCCPVWTKHYNYVSQGNRENDTFNDAIASKYEKCLLKCSEGEYRWDKLKFDSLLNTVDDVKKLYTIGFRRFKISGRGFLENHLSEKRSDNNSGFQDKLNIITELYNII